MIEPMLDQADITNIKSLSSRLYSIDNGIDSLREQMTINDNNIMLELHNDIFCNTNAIMYRLNNMNLLTMQSIIHNNSKCKVANFELVLVGDDAVSGDTYYQFTILTRKLALNFIIVGNGFYGYDYDILMKYIEDEKVYLVDICQDTDDKGDIKLKIYLKYKKLFKNDDIIITAKNIKEIKINRI